MLAVPSTLRADLDETGRVVGVVKSCRVLWVGGSDSRFPQTTLVIEPG